MGFVSAMLTVKATIEGIQELQRANAEILKAVSPRGSLGEAVRYATAAAQRYAMTVTPVWTGALRASHMTEFHEGRDDAEGRVFISHVTRNPITGKPPFKYGPEIHFGERAFYERTVREEGPTIIENALQIVHGRLPRGAIASSIHTLLDSEWA